MGDMMREEVLIVDKFTEIVEATSRLYGSTVHYDYGHGLEIMKRLQDMTKATGKAHKKYPLIILLLDIDEKGNDDPGIDSDVNLKFFIVNLTDPKWSSQDRTRKSFKPILLPIYDYFITAIEKSGYFRHPGKITADRTMHYFWGKTGLWGNTGNIFDDYLDCIELTIDLKVKKLYICKK